ncbi:TPA: CfaE/CblD family pilus tip adhesin, partial [Salmonella enterica]
MLRVVILTLLSVGVAYADHFDNPLPGWTSYTAEFNGKTELSSPTLKEYELNYFYIETNEGGKYNSFNKKFWVSCVAPDSISTGACTGVTDHLSLQFVEQKTGATHIALLRGYLEGPEGPEYTFLGKVYSGTYDPHEGLAVLLNDSEIKKFPSGGVWKSRLMLKQHSTRDPSFSANITLDITLSLTDSKNIRIWFPQSHGSTTSVTLPSHPFRPVTVDACLYDGYNSNSNRLDVMFNSQNAGPDNTFKLVSLSSSGRLHYQVRVAPPGNPGALTEVSPGETVTYT